MNGIIPAKTVYDPLFCFALSYPVEVLDAVLGNWLFFASVAMFIRARVHYGRARAAELDAFDAIKEAEDSMAAIRSVAGHELPVTSSRPATTANLPAGPSNTTVEAGTILDDFTAGLGLQSGPARPSIGSPRD